jgi:hypothetical protein
MNSRSKVLRACPLPRCKIERNAGSCRADPTRSARWPARVNLAAFWQQIAPIVPFFSTLQTSKYFTVCYLQIAAHLDTEAGIVMLICEFLLPTDASSLALDLRRNLGDQFAFRTERWAQSTSISKLFFTDFRSFFMDTKDTDRLNLTAAPKCKLEV